MNIFDLLLSSETPKLAEQLMEILTKYVFPVVLVATVVWVIYLAVQLGRANSEGERKKAKDAFIKAAVAFLIIAAIYGILYFIKDNMNQFGWGTPSDNYTGPVNSSSVFSIIDFLLTLLS